MNKLEELRNLVAELFDKAEDRKTIEQAAVVNEKINDIQREQDALAKDYKDLVKDYKEVVVHSSFKPTGKVGETTADGPSTFNADQQLGSILAQFDGK